MRFLHAGSKVACGSCGQAVEFPVPAAGRPLEQGRPVLVEADVPTALLRGCPQTGSGQRPCARLVLVEAGRDPVARIGGSPVLREDFVALTDGSPPQRARVVDPASRLGAGVLPALFQAVLRDGDGNPRPDEELTVDLGDGPQTVRSDAEGRVTLRRGRRSAYAELVPPTRPPPTPPPTPPAPTPPPAAGRTWEAAPGVRLGEGMPALLDALGAKWQAATGRTLFVTSGVRSAREQARAMLTKLRAGGRSQLSIYRNRAAADEVGDAWERGGGEEELTAVIQGQVDRGVLLSAHLGGRAVDLRTRDLSPADRQQLQRLAAEHGRSLYESTPPHLHLERPRSSP